MSFLSNLVYISMITTGFSFLQYFIILKHWLSISNSWLFTDIHFVYSWGFFTFIWYVFNKENKQ